MEILRFCGNSRGLFSSELNTGHTLTQNSAPQGTLKYEIDANSNSVATRGWKTQRDFEAVVDEPLEGGQRSNLFGLLVRTLWVKDNG